MLRHEAEVVQPGQFSGYAASAVERGSPKERLSLFRHQNLRNFQAEGRTQRVTTHPAHFRLSTGVALI